ncbi:homeobox protein CHOX-CAD isoform X2 [Aethina tumida]|uniref:homeobox protein CHOX-CAD isoform X2 n=1 Tax=Aethina tumida TaxID=116153 RepID=UPI002147C05F|nr:homeobox protein CHOX-CAD isoform X2 [Aethina tumida]
MSMVSYYGTGMYTHQQPVAGAQSHFQSNVPMAWYPGYHQSPQMTPTGQYPSCLEEQQMWHSHPAPSHPAVFKHDYQDYVPNPAIATGGHLEPETQFPSPPITVSGSEMSSPGAGGNMSPQGGQMTRPVQARSPYEWIKKNNYQQQPQPGKTRTKDKYRVVYTDHQRIELEKEFTFNNKYITIRRKSELAANLGLSERQIKIWFQNRRAKERKQNKKRNEEKHQIDAINTTPQYQPNLMTQHPAMHQMDMTNSRLPMMQNQQLMEKYNQMKLENLEAERDQMG